MQSNLAPLNSATREGILLCAGEKSGKEKRFYEVMIAIADDEYSAHLNSLKRGVRDGQDIRADPGIRKARSS